MASQPSLSGADRIRSLQDQDSIFQAFDSYPWKKDTAFMSGLQAILGQPSQDGTTVPAPSSNSSGGSPTDMATHARIFYYAQRIGVNIDFAAYQSWLEKNPSHKVPDILPDEYRREKDQDQDKQQAQPTSLAPSWQQAAPKADLYVDKTAQSAQSAAAGGEPNYPMGFAEMIKLLQEGKPIPGIRQIPNTIARDPSVKPVGSRPAPKKPWERDNAAAFTPELDSNKTLDSEFPPVEADNLSTTAPEAVQS